MSTQTITPPTKSSPTSAVDAGWWLVGGVSSESLSRIPVNSSSFVVGRRSECHLSLRSHCVSGRHAEILMVGDSLFLRDLNSTNGTYLNRRPIKTPTPVEPGDHIQIADVEFRVEFRRPDPILDDTNILDQKKTNPAVRSLQRDWVMSQLEDLIAQKAVVPHYQPIIDLIRNERFGFESLARSHADGLETAMKMFRTAEMVNREVALSIVCRDVAIRNTPRTNPCLPVFVNTHPHESMEIDVIPTIYALREQRPDVPIVVEFHEKTIQSSAIMLENKSRLADLGVRIAYDDFGAGQSRLLELVQAPPDFLKFDQSLIRDIHYANAYHQRMLVMLIEIAHDFGISTIAEGVELVEEAETVAQIGFKLAQGYYFGCPEPNPNLDWKPVRPMN